MSTPTLSRTDLRKFIRFCSEARGSGDFEIHFGLSRGEVDTLKSSLGIASPADAKALINDVITLQQREEELRADTEQAAAKKSRAEAQARMDATAARRAAEVAKKRSRVLNATKVKNEDQKRQRRFDRQQTKTAVAQKTSWRLPKDVDPEAFSRDIRVRGLRFTCDRYGVTRSDIMSEASRLKLHINFDLVPR
jgi:hypothetical protein